MDPETGMVASYTFFGDLRVTWVCVYVCMYNIDLHTGIYSEGAVQYWLEVESQNFFIDIDLILIREKKNQLIFIDIFEVFNFFDTQKFKWEMFDGTNSMASIWSDFMFVLLSLINRPADVRAPWCALLYNFSLPISPSHLGSWLFWPLIFLTFQLFI